MSDSPHTITMTFDMTDPDGRMAFDSARQGLARGLVMWDLAQEMRGCVKHGSGPSDGVGSVDIRDGIEIATQHWRDRLWDLMELHGVTEVE